MTANGGPAVDWAAPGPDPVPTLSDERVRLRALGPDDLDWLRAAETGAWLSFRWRLHGAHPHPQEYAEQIWAGTLALFVAESATDARPLGILSAYQPDHRNGHCRVAAARLESSGSADALFLAGLTMFFDYLFSGWPFRKLYLETPEFNIAQFRSALDRGVLQLEGRLREYVFLADRYWDVLFLSVSRQSWAEFRTTTLGRRLVGAAAADRTAERSRAGTLPDDFLFVDPPVASPGHQLGTRDVRIPALTLGGAR